jgi:hypothetical protein
MSGFFQLATPPEGPDFLPQVVADLCSTDLAFISWLTFAESHGSGHKSLLPTPPGTAENHPLMPPVYLFNSSDRMVDSIAISRLMVGCGSPKTLRTKADLDKLTQRYGMGHLYYIKRVSPRIVTLLIVLVSTD